MNLIFCFLLGWAFLAQSEAKLVCNKTIIAERGLCKIIQLTSCRAISSSREPAECSGVTWRFTRLCTIFTNCTLDLTTTSTTTTGPASFLTTNTVQTTTPSSPSTTTIRTTTSTTTTKPQTIQPKHDLTKANEDFKNYCDCFDHFWDAAVCFKRDFTSTSCLFKTCNTTSCPVTRIEYDVSCYELICQKPDTTTSSTSTTSQPSPQPDHRGRNTAITVCAVLGSLLLAAAGFAVYQKFGCLWVSASTEELSPILRLRTEADLFRIVDDLDGFEEIELNSFVNQNN